MVDGFDGGHVGVVESATVVLVAPVLSPATVDEVSPTDVVGAVVVLSDGGTLRRHPDAGATLEPVTLETGVDPSTDVAVGELVSVGAGLGV
ncbi:MAG TPA: hypothetical protein PKV27_13295, partial [Ilumatobacteraceae bacterium]|nr:hypothetical protein [Ilumatobacteraceae bacterium]